MMFAPTAQQGSPRQGPRAKSGSVRDRLNEGRRTRGRKPWTGREIRKPGSQEAMKVPHHAGPAIPAIRTPRLSIYTEAAQSPRLFYLREADPFAPPALCARVKALAPGSHAFESAASYSREELESDSVLSTKSPPPPAAPISISIGSRSPAAPLSISIYRHSISGQACHRGEHFLPCPHQRRVSIREMRLSDCSRVARLTTHSGAPTSLSIWASISSARLRRILSARQVR